jgi:hypothetical protein
MREARKAAGKKAAPATRGGGVKKARQPYARSVTTQEFEDVMEYFVREAQVKTDAYVREHPSSPLAQATPWWSMDNPSWHTSADLSRVGITEGVNRLPLPPASGDMHKVIEHVHGTLVKELNKWFIRNRNRPGVSSAAVVKGAVEEIFFHTITPASVSADVESLPKLWKWIKDNKGSKGAPAKLRWEEGWGAGGSRGEQGSLATHQLCLHSPKPMPINPASPIYSFPPHASPHACAGSRKASSRMAGALALAIGGGGGGCSGGGGRCNAGQPGCRPGCRLLCQSYYHPCSVKSTEGERGGDEGEAREEWLWWWYRRCGPCTPCWHSRHSRAQGGAGPLQQEAPPHASPMHTASTANMQVMPMGKAHHSTYATQTAGCACPWALGMPAAAIAQLPTWAPTLPVAPTLLGVKVQQGERKGLAGWLGRAEALTQFEPLCSTAPSKVHCDTPPPVCSPPTNTTHCTSQSSGPGSRACSQVPLTCTPRPAMHIASISSHAW